MKAIFAGIALLWASAAFAEPEIGTVRSSGYPLTRNGELFGCEIEFKNLHWDSAYQHNRIVVSGSISMQQAQSTPYFSYKVVVEDLIENGPDVSAKPSTPVSINLVAPNGRSTKDIKFVSKESDTPGGRINVYGFSDQFTEIMTSIVESQSAVILFNRRPEGLDVRVPVDFTVASTDAAGKKTTNNATISNFMSCTRTLLQGILKVSPK
jgi:hypothetical protein